MIANGVSLTLKKGYGQSVLAEESDSEASSAYHEPYHLLPRPKTKPEYGSLLGKDSSNNVEKGTILVLLAGTP